MVFFHKILFMEFLTKPFVRRSFAFALFIVVTFYYNMENIKKELGGVLFYDLEMDLYDNYFVSET
ncbi:hypothetical protein STRDD10_01015 [Streptococcus sp. DD10]|nr:hypothetical protein STRDD10_01015 [Streptococcus sp. DD10]